MVQGDLENIEIRTKFYFKLYSFAYLSPFIVFSFDPKAHAF